MKVSPGRLLIQFGVLLAGCALCGTDLRAQSDVPTAPSRDATLAGVTVRAADAFYDPPAQLPAQPGTLLRSEPLEDVTLPKGMRGWRILYTTTVDD